MSSRRHLIELGGNQDALLLASQWKQWNGAPMPCQSLAESPDIPLFAEAESRAEEQTASRSR
jgi:hypothetical protein